jgi:hypothetical protein
MRRSTGRALLGVAAPLALFACTSPIATSSNYIAPPMSPWSGAAPRLEGCKLAITAIADARLDPTTIGMIGPRPVRGPADAPAWLASVLKSLTRYGVDVSFPPPGAAPKEGLTASVTLVTLWVASVTIAKTGSVVLSVRYARDGAVVKQANYRGRDSGPDWFGSSDEVQAMIDDTAGQAVKAMADDLSSLCAPAEQQPSSSSAVHD